MEKIDFQSYVEQMDLYESGLARIRRMLWGDVPSVDSVGIITAYNPNSSPPIPGGTEQENRAANDNLNRSLEADLRSANYGPIKVQGRFGGDEVSFMVPNISRDELVALGQRHKQVAVIWGQKQQDQGGPFFKFEYIEGGKTLSVKDYHVGNPDVQSRDDFFTQAQGRKFIIPFFAPDPYFRHKRVRQGVIEPGQPEDQESQLRRAEDFFIPFFDNPLQKIELPDGLSEVSYYNKKLPLDERTRELVEQIRDCEEELRTPGKVEKWYWTRRGLIQNALVELSK